MVTNYKLKNDPLNMKRVKTHMKGMIEQGKKIEKKAEETYKYFKDFVDKEPGSDTDTSKKCMIDALKIQKEARQYSLKVFELLVKLYLQESGKSKKGEPTSMEDLLEGE